MRWKLPLLIGLLASGAVAAAMVRAQDTSGTGGSLRSRPTPATPLDAPSRARATTSGGLAERLHQARQSVAEEYAPEGDGTPALLQPTPETGEPDPAASAPTPAPQTSHTGIPSVLKRGVAAEAPAVRTAAMDAKVGARPSNPPPPTPANAGAFQTPAGARPLGSPPPGARAPQSPAASATQLPPAPEAEAVAPQDAEEYESGSSRRRPATGLASPPEDGAPAGLAPTPRIDSARLHGPTTGKEPVMVGGGPQLRLETLGPKAVVRGRPATYTLVISNVGEAPARGVAVHLESRQAVEFGVGQASHGGAELHRTPAGGAMLLWSMPELPRGAKAELSVTAVTRESRPIELIASWTSEPAVATAPIDVLEPQLAMTLSGPKDVMFGETKIYTITLTNPGTGDVENVMLALAPLSSSQEPPQARNIGTLRAGERKEIPIQLTAREAGLLAIRAEASAEGGLHAEAAEEVMVRRAQVQLTIEGPPLKYAGSTAEYLVRVVNAGNAPAEDVAVLAAMPDGVEYVPGNDGGTVQTDGVAWRVGSLAPRDERSFTFTCNMQEEGDKRFTLQARGTGDVQATAAATTRVEALADLKLVVNDPPGAIPLGKEITYEVRVLNRGTKAASGIEVSAFFSEGIEPTGTDGFQAKLSPGQVTAAPIAVLEAGAEIVLKIRAQASLPGNHIFRAVVQCANPETRLATEETTRFVGTPQPGQTPAATPGTVPAAPEGPRLSERPASSDFQPLKR